MKWALVILALLVALPALAVNLLGTDATFGWTQDDEIQPEGWEVFVSRDGGEFVHEQVVTEKMVTLSGAPNETISITVKAFIGNAHSESSEPSDPITFRVLSAPGGPALHCPGGVREIAPGWFSLADC